MQATPGAEEKRQKLRDRFYKERFEAQRRLSKRVASSLEVNEILERLREEARALIPRAMEACILLLDPDAPQYTRPLQCALYERPVNCLSCKRHRPAVRRAIVKKKAVLVHHSGPIVRHNGERVETGPEMAVPVFQEGRVVAVVSVVAHPGACFSRKDFYLLKDLADFVGGVIERAEKHWEITQEKIRISQILGHLSPFVPLSVRKIVEKNPELATQEKEKREATVLFLDLEDYTRLSERLPETRVNELIETLFSSFVDPIHRSHGDIVETAGDGLMIVFSDHEARANAVDAVRAAFDIHDLTAKVSSEICSGQYQLRVNMGINSGIALVGMTRFQGTLGTRMTYTASGPVTILAARLAELAQGGDILIGEETRNLIENLWPVYDRGFVELKGIDDPVHVYSLLQPA